MSILSKVLARIKAGEISREDAAELLQCSERQVNRHMKQYGIERPPSPVHARRAETEKKRARKHQAALEVIAGCGIDAAAKGVCSVRTLYRYVEKLRKDQEKGLE